MRIIIAEDHPMFRSGVRGLLATTDDLEVVGEAADGEEAVRIAGELLPELVLMDIRMPGLNGIEATRLIRERYPRTEVLILSMHSDDQSVFTAMRAGAKGYVLKDADEEELLQSIRMVGSGRAVFGTGIAERMMQYFAAHAGSAGDGPSAVGGGGGNGADDGAGGRTGTDWRQLAASETFSGLTRREAEILARIASGDTNAQIAERLFISAKTVANHVSTILSKLQVLDRHEARKLVERSRPPERP
ncbi:DNA-binding response regulator, NarL/FixJ family, contains REC and HTH domains [Cohnella sp. OV330]|uniref:response regulator transcription factor n=1 Tax=Cohnella sp. OV330 TaxID=1855288 RepID=UPI0008F24E43|nr:response regulator transcription factor [Cohnella sp. OV330]SFB50695.1 DNA-binding response regulator, NarL/FixJ family, contains REC and HTH domains [Cohnella sp. OV330]